jgi:hypothetical protein
MMCDLGISWSAEVLEWWSIDTLNNFLFWFDTLGFLASDFSPFTSGIYLR